MANSLLISIVTWNSADSIVRCIESVLAQTYRNFQLSIVDNNSSDNTCSLVEVFHDDRITFTRMKENTGFCGGHNFAISRWSSEFVLLVNPDIIMNADYVARALDTMQRYPGAGTVCGLLLQASPEDPEAKVDSAGLEKTRSGNMSMRCYNQKRSECALEETEVFGSDGALPLYRRTMIDMISYNGQFFDEMFFAHKEDWDISWRSSIYGWKTIFNPMCIAVHPRHFKPGSLKVRRYVADHVKLHAVKNQLILLLKNEKLSTFLAHSIFIMPRQLIIFLYIAFLERSSLKAYTYVWKNLKSIMEKRRIVQSHRNELQVAAASSDREQRKQASLR